MNESMLYVAALATASVCLTLAWRQDRKETRTLYFFLCHRCKKWRKKQKGLPNICVCGDGRFE